MSRFWLIALGLFWLVMNYLLWRAEFGTLSKTGSPLPPEIVWRKILETPDRSGLEVWRHDEKIGYCSWTVTQLASEQEIAIGAPTDPGSEELEGMIEDIETYQLQMEGNLTLGEDRRRVRFSCHAQLNGEQDWEEIVVRVGVKKSWLEFSAHAASEEVQVKFEQDGSNWEQEWSFEELRDPARLMGRLGFTLPWIGLPGLIGLPADMGSQDMALGIVWEARTDWVEMAHARLRVYRVEATILDRYPIKITISRAGEILRADLPGEVTLTNEALMGF